MGSSYRLNGRLSQRSCRNCAGSHIAIRIASIAFACIMVNCNFQLGRQQPIHSLQIRRNAPGRLEAESDRTYKSHQQIASCGKSSFIKGTQADKEDR